jgi:hypothetical protein
MYNPRQRHIELVTASRASDKLMSSTPLEIGPGQNALLQVSNLAINVAATDQSNCFEVIKKTNCLPSSDAEDPFAEEWYLNKSKILLKPNGDYNMLLLGPTLTRDNLYGGRSIRSNENIKKYIKDTQLLKEFGLISLEYVNEEVYQIEVHMPEEAYGGISKLTILVADSRIHS